MHSLVGNSWTYDVRSPTPPRLWGRRNPGCNPLVAPWQSPMKLAASDIGHIAPSVIGSKTPNSVSSAARPRNSCLITSVVNTTEPLLTVPMRFERLYSGLLTLRPLIRPQATTDRIAQGLTVRVSFAPGGEVEILEATPGTANQKDYYLIEMVTIHSGSEHGAPSYGSLAEVQFILNPLNNTNSTSAPAGRLGGPRTIVISVPVVLGTTVPLARRMSSPARSFLSQMLIKIRSLATEIGGGLSSSAGGIAEPVGTEEATIASDDAEADATPVFVTGDPILNVAVAGTGGFNSARIYWANTVPLLPVPVRIVTSEEGDDSVSEVEMVPNVMYSYEGTLTFPPCLPVDNSSSVPDYSPRVNTSRFLEAYLGSTGGPNLPISTPTVQHIITQPYLASQTTIDAITFLSATPSLTVTISDANVISTNYIPITTARPPQNRSGRSFTPMSTALPLFEDATLSQKNWATDDKKPSSIRIGSADNSFIVSGITTVSQRLHQHSLTIMRSNQLNTRLRVVIIVLALLCFSVFVYIILLLLVRCDMAELPTAIGGKRTYVDFWTNPRSVLPAKFDELDADGSVRSEDIPDDEDAVGGRRRKRRTIPTHYDHRPRYTTSIKIVKKPSKNSKRKVYRSWLQDDAEDSQVDKRMLLPMNDSTRLNPPPTPQMYTSTNEQTKDGEAKNPLAIAQLPKHKLAFNMQTTTMTKSPKNAGPVARQTNNPLQSASKQQNKE